MHTPAMKAGLTRKFKKFWSGPYKVIRKISELNYEVVSQDNRKQIVHINRLKKCYNQSLEPQAKSEDSAEAAETENETPRFE